MADRKLKTVTRTQGSNEALKDGSIKPRTFAFEFEEFPVLPDAFRRMVRGHEFDICEMAMTTYVCARAYGKRFTALPIFLVRGFHHGTIVTSAKAGVKSPKELEGKKVGVNRGYTVTAGLWARSVLEDEYGVDLRKITWVLSGDEHVTEYRPPANVVPIAPGKKIPELLATGELAAAVGIDSFSADVKLLIPNSLEAGPAALRQRGHYPINHAIVVKDELLQAEPGLAADIFDTFVRAKRPYIERLKAGKVAKPTIADTMHKRVMDITGMDPLPYGIAPNRKTLEELLKHCRTQGIVTRQFTVDELFAPGTHALAG